MRIIDPGPLVGRTISHFTIVEKLGEGGMGEVFLARDLQLERHVALKVLSTDIVGDSSRLKRLQREARSQAALDHPNIVPIYSFEHDEDLHFLTMAFVDGHGLETVIPDGGMGLRELLDLAVPLADALRVAHRHGIIHRDLKPANVMIDREGRPRILDFGLAKKNLGTTGDDSEVPTAQLSELLTREGTIVGTFPYMSPEQAEGKPVDARSDLFSFGVMLYEMACGKRPFHGDTLMSLVASILREPHRPLSEMRPLLPERLDAIVSKCLEKDPDNRYATAQHLLSDLEELRSVITLASTPEASSTMTTAIRPAETGVAFRLKGARRGAIWLTAVLAVVTATGTGIWKFWSGRNEGRVLAVLPFENIQDDPDADYLCEGVADSLISQLSRIRTLSVTPLNAVLSLRGRVVDPLEAGRQLGADLVLTGGIDLPGDRMQVRAELLEVQSGSRLWSNSYDRPAEDLVHVQNEIAAAILELGRSGLTNEERQELVRSPTKNGEAYDLFLQARHLHRLGSEDDYLLSLDLLQRATVRDPEFARAYVQLAGTYAAMAVNGYQRPTDAWAQTNRYLRQAIALDPTLPEIHGIQHAMAFFFDWDWEGAERERELAMQLPVGEFDPDFYRTFSLELLALGHPDEALAVARRSRELDSLSIGLAMLEADYLARVGNLQDAIAIYERAIEVEPQNPDQYFGLAEVLFEQGRVEEAIETRRQAHAMAGDQEMVDLFSTASGENGYREADRAWIAEQLVWLEARSAWGYVSPLDRARAHAQLGNNEKAFEFLSAALDDRSPGLVFLNVDHAWDGLRGDPRFEEAVREVGLPPTS